MLNGQSEHLAMVFCSLAQKYGEAQSGQRDRKIDQQEPSIGEPSQVRVRIEKDPEQTQGQGRPRDNAHEPDDRHSSAEARWSRCGERSVTLIAHDSEGSLEARNSASRKRQEDERGHGNDERAKLEDGPGDGLGEILGRTNKPQNGWEAHEQEKDAGDDQTGDSRCPASRCNPTTKGDQLEDQKKQDAKKVPVSLSLGHLSHTTKIAENENKEKPSDQQNDTG